MSRSAIALSRPSRGAAPRADLCEVQCIDPRKVASARRAAPRPEAVQTVADTLRVLGDPTRLRLLDALSRHELCVCDLALIVGASQSTVSHSLRALRQLRLVTYRKAGKIAYYSLDNPRIASLLRVAFEHAARS